MRAAAILVLASALGLAAFAGWGLFTEAGRHRYDEMDGIYPMLAGCGAAIGLLVAAILSLLGRRRSDTQSVES